MELDPANAHYHVPLPSNRRGHFGMLDRLTHRCHIFEMNGESYRFRESAKAAKKKTGK